MIAKLNPGIIKVIEDPAPEPKIQTSAWMVVVWPAFMVACVLEMVIFGLVDPGSIFEWANEQAAGSTWSRTTIYSLSFIVLWGALMISSALTLVLSNATSLSGER